MNKVGFSRKEMFDPVTGETVIIDKDFNSLKTEREAYLEESNNRLRDICIKKIDTTMIGALDAIESEIALFSENLADSDKIKLRGLYSKVRSRVLDNGNNQKRAIVEEFKHYTIDWQKYKITMQVKSKD
jgi:hypothetical protein